MSVPLQRPYEQPRDGVPAPERDSLPGLHIHQPEVVEKQPHWLALVKALRPHQWAKNALLFLPMLFAHQLGSMHKWLAVSLAFGVFSACASAVYLLNDVKDIDADRRHPVKRHRPLAAGEISLREAVLMAVLLLTAAFGISLALMPAAFTGLLAVYLGLTTAYTLYVKRALFLDVVVLAGLYTLRLLTGGVVADVLLSPWLKAFAMFFFVSLALIKRCVELRETAVSGREESTSRGYVADDAEALQIAGIVSGIVSVVVFCLYLSSDIVQKLYPHGEILWLIAPLLLYWIVRIWLLARRSAKWEDPVHAVTTDLNSYAVGLACVALVLVASW